MLRLLGGGRRGRLAAYGLPHRFSGHSMGAAAGARGFWWGDDGDSNRRETGDKPSSDQAAAMGGEQDTSGLVIHPDSAPRAVGIGDDAPKPSPIPVIPLGHRPLFPGMVQGLLVTDPPTIRGLAERLQQGENYVGVFLRKQPPLEGGVPEVVQSIRELHSVGTLAQIHNMMDSGPNSQLFLTLHRRIEWQKELTQGPPMSAEVTHWSRPLDPPEAEAEIVKALCNEVVAGIRDLVKLNPLFREHAQYFTSRIDTSNPYALADFAASLTTSDAEELQAVLEEPSAKERLSKVLLLVSKEREMSKIQQEIQKQVEDKMSKTQREYFLHEQLKSIKKELGMEKDDKEALILKFRERMESAIDISKEARATFEEEVEKLSMLEKNSPEFNTTRNYLDWLSSMPWGRATEENFDLVQASKVLDEEHYGLEEVKNRILEFIAVGKLKGSVQGKIICLVGPPGVGKTSIGSSIAKALNREFFRFSVGGLTDVAEIKGHRRTYVGAMPGKPIQCLKATGSSNPLILIDEIDKLGRGYQGDPASALLELLDPSQNASFADHYMDIPLDLSKALFICTANVTDTIPGPLLDRMEMVRLSGYDLPEKVKIAQQYLIPKALRDSGLADADQSLTAAGGEDASSSGNKVSVPVPAGLEMDESAIYSLVRWYCREAGVRQLSQRIERICRKLAFEVVQHGETGDANNGSKAGWKVSEANLADYVGKPVFTSDRLYEDQPPAGVVMGLAWTAMGGSSLYIESISTTPRQEADPEMNGLQEKGGGGRLVTTGQLGDVMRESSAIAHSFARTFLRHQVPGQAENRFLDTAEVHMHVPEGATPKDGPSAGVTMVTSLLSLATSRAVRKDVAMTGEVSLTGKVLAVGGIKEKTIAARRAGITCLVLPMANKRDFEELPEYLRKGLEIHFATEYADVYSVAFCEDLSSPLTADF
uniref:Lon protease homolog n=1 Tax=Rhizochromulina marina TaxID=1034831 RepID=A0A7S2RZQ8_9STRA|mmetsp:Transcript_23221/g.67749  ORF Transcript_23221/g.67749 Transcript_23221/m.67749 type:complete len:934 (+) Transcript_23221:78-2879(+)